MCRLLAQTACSSSPSTGLYRAVGAKTATRPRPQFTDHYFTGDYPTRLLDKAAETMGRKVSVLASNG